VDGLLSLPDGRPFATGAATYSVGQPGAKMAGRILLQVSVEGVPTIAAVDTGGYYFVCRPDLAEELAPRLTDPLGQATLEIRGIKYRGTLYLLSVELPASQGESLVVPATVFIPKLAHGQEWRLPSFVGFAGMLDRMRFAVDPATDTFYFGPLE
jgi:hypothetical protein